MTAADTRPDAATAGNQPTGLRIAVENGDPDTGAVNVELAARITGRHPEAIRRWIREGVLPAHRIGTGPKAPWYVYLRDLALIAGKQRRASPGKRRTR